MAVSEQTPYIEYTANGITTSFALEFDCDNQDHLIVLIDDVEPVIGSWSLIGGAVVFNNAPGNGKKITIQRNTPFSRNTDYQSYNNSFRPHSVNGDFDRVWWKIQELGVRDWLLDLKIQKFRDDVNLTAMEETLEQAQSLRDDTAAFAVEVKDNVVQSQTLLANTTAKASAAASSAISANSSKDLAKQYADNIDASLTAIAGGHKAYATLAGALSDKSTFPMNSIIEITLDGANNGAYYWNGADLTKSDYDPLTQAKTYTDSEIVKRTEEVNNSNYAYAAIDDSGKIALAIKKDGTTEVTNLEAQSILVNHVDASVITTNGLNIADSVIEKTESSDLLYAITDTSGSIALSVNKSGVVAIPQLLQSNGSGAVKTLRIGSDDSIMHIGDSMTASHYCLQNKSYISQLSQLSPFRHINYGVSSEEAIDMQKRVLQDTQVFSSSIKDSKPKYLFITTYTNDGVARSDLKYFQENIRRLIDVSLALGVQPVLVGYWNMVQSADHQSLKAVADEYKIQAVWCDVLNKQVGTYTPTSVLFNEPHTGTRTNGLWWIPMHDFVQQLPVLRTIKIYRKRASLAVTTDADLLYKDIVDKGNKWQEITVGHYSFSDTKAYKFDEINTLVTADRAWALREDEYVKLQNKAAISISDYMLIEYTLDAYPQNLMSLQLNLDLTGTFEVFVRNFHDASTVVNRPATASDSAYQAVWNKPRGAWRAVTVSSGKVIIDKADIIRSMVGNKISIMIKGSGSIKDVSVDYVSDKYESRPSYPQKLNEKLGDELLVQPLVGNTAQLAGWVTTGTVNTLVPIDSPKIPRKPDQDTPVDGVCVLTTSNSIQQSVTLSTKEDMRTFKVVVWGRYFPKAFLDRTLAAYSSLDAAQITDRSIGGNVSDITKDSFDVKRIQLLSWGTTTQPSYVGAYQTGFAGLFYRPITFYVEVQPYETQLNIKISALDNDVQIAKVSIKEVI